LIHYLDKAIVNHYILQAISVILQQFEPQNLLSIQKYNNPNFILVFANFGVFAKR